MKKLLAAFVIIGLLSSGCIFRRPIEVKKEYYASGNLKLVRKIYKKGEKVEYFTDGPVHQRAGGKKK